MRRFVKRALAAVVGLLVVFTVVVGFAHTRAGRLLAFVAFGKAKGGACPLGYDVAQTPEQKESARRAFAASHGGEARAAARPALGFELDRTTRADARAWASAHGITCKEARTGPDLDCAAVPDDALAAAFRGAPVVSVWLTFGARDTLTTVVVVRRSPDAAAISATFAAITAAVSSQAGPARMTDGDPSVERLSAGLLRQASAEYRFRDYYALARATNMGNGFALTEEYRSLPD